MDYSSTMGANDVFRSTYFWLNTLLSVSFMLLKGTPAESYM
jgi:hypothetical protein